MDKALAESGGDAFIGEEFTDEVIVGRLDRCLARYLLIFKVKDIFLGVRQKSVPKNRVGQI